MLLSPIISVVKFLPQMKTILKQSTAFQQSSPPIMPALQRARPKEKSTKLQLRVTTPGASHIQLSNCWDSILPKIGESDTELHDNWRRKNLQNMRCVAFSMRLYIPLQFLCLFCFFPPSKLKLASIATTWLTVCPWANNTETWYWKYGFDAPLMLSWLLQSSRHTRFEEWQTRGLIQLPKHRLLFVETLYMDQH